MRSKPFGGRQITNFPVNAFARRLFYSRIKKVKTLKSVKPGRGPSFLQGFMCVAVALFGVIWTVMTVSAADPSVTLPYSSITISKGKTVSLKAKVSGVSKYTLVWTSSDKSIVSVTDEGKITGVKKGSADVTVAIKNTDASAKVKVTVGTPVTGVTVSEKSISVKNG